MKASLALIGILAALAAVPTALAGNTGNGTPFITDTLGGNGHRAQAPAQGYHFITDTLAPGGGPAIQPAFPSSGFSWSDASVGAATAAGALLVLLGMSVIVVRRRTRLAI